MNSLTPRSCASIARSRSDSLAIKMNGNSLSKFEDLRVELAKFGPTDSVSVVFERPFGPKIIKQEVNVQLGERP